MSVKEDGAPRKDYGALHRFLRYLVRPFAAITFWIEQVCSRIETKRELNKWNGGNQ
jgi:hypothetical protein